jgi:hypothetical protein
MVTIGVASVVSGDRANYTSQPATCRLARAPPALARRHDAPPLALAPDTPLGETHTRMEAAGIGRGRGGDGTLVGRVGVVRRCRPCATSLV